MPKLPVLLHLVFHPESESARALARHIHRELNDDLVVPGLRVPTVFCPIGIGGKPPSTNRLNAAQRSFPVILADDRLTIDDDWCRFVGDLWSQCQGTPHRFIAFQLTANAWPLDDRLRVVSFAKAYLEQASVRDAFVVRRLITELCLHLLNRDVPKDHPKAPVKLFLSHAKIDLKNEPKVAEALIAYLKADQPVEAWVDSGDIPSGSLFAEEIANGVANTSLLAVLTDNYASREWCREEVLLAKEKQRPLAVVDALTKYEVRSFPYLGNVPRVRWNGDPGAAVLLLLKETLRNLHVTDVLNQFKQPGEEVFIRPPELATLVGLAPGTSLVYPDPPLGVGEKRRLEKTKVTFTTPLQRLADNTSLRGKEIALSMSESSDIEQHGLDLLHLEGSMLELSRYLLIQGATLAYGGHLGSEGYTQKLLELVRTHNALDGVKAVDRVVNYRGWPLPRLGTEELAKINRELKVDERPRPADVTEELAKEFTEKPAKFPGDDSGIHRYAWARGMTAMREYQTDQKRDKPIVARIALGGKYGPTLTPIEGGATEKRWYVSRIPGVLEEILLSVKAGQPVFLIGAFGGVARLVIDLLQGSNRPEATWEYQKQAPFAPEMRQIYETRGPVWWDYPEMLALLREKGIAGINPLLTEEEHRELFETIDVWRMVEIVLAGLGRRR